MDAVIKGNFTQFKISHHILVAWGCLLSFCDYEEFLLKHREQRSENLIFDVQQIHTLELLL